MSVIAEIISWSQNRAPWQQDALRRLFEKDELEEQDYDELVEICKSTSGISQQSSVQPTPPTDGENGDDHVSDQVKLRSISNLVNINSLADGAELPFADDGLTIIYGSNGSGKSGYFRILQMLCRARKKPRQILPNVFEQHSSEPSATVTYLVGDDERSVSWNNDAESPAELKYVSVFDRSCASVYIESDQEVAYMPLGLDLFDKLAQACARVKQKLEYEKSQLETSLEVPDFVKASSIYSLLSNLTDGEIIGTIRSFPDFNDEDDKRLKELTELVSALKSSDPSKKIAELRTKKSRIDQLTTIIKNQEISFGEEAIKKIKSERKLAIELREAAKVAADRLFGEQPLPGVGSDVWVQLWESARVYSENHAYPNSPFPFVDEQARCPLCQQQLSDEALARVVSFEEHIKADISSKAELAIKTYNESIKIVNRLEIPESVDEDLIIEIEAYDGALAEGITSLLRTARALRQAIINQEENFDPIVIPEPTYSSKLEGLAQKIELDARQLTQNISADRSTNPLEIELTELRAKQWVGQSIQDIESEIVRQLKIDAYDTAINDETNTQGITTKSNELTEQYVTIALKEAFTTELERISANGLSVELERHRGQRGIVYHQLKLAGAQQGDLASIMSEGENQAIALAAFFAESSQNPVIAPLVFDDPITSLDHLRREYVAERIISEAQSHQVIVFTHDLPFMRDLCEIAEETVNYRIIYLRRENGISAPPSAEPLWEDMNITQRMRFLRNLAQEARTVNNSGDTIRYESFIRQAYGYLREAWESSIEFVLFNGAVRRLDRAVHTRQLALLVGQTITQEDVSAVTMGMTISSRRLRGHARPDAVNSSQLPTPEMFTGDVDELNAFVTDVAQRRSN